MTFTTQERAAKYKSDWKILAKILIGIFPLSEKLSNQFTGDAVDYWGSGVLRVKNQNVNTSIPHRSHQLPREDPGLNSFPSERQEHPVHMGILEVTLEYRLSTLPPLDLHFETLHFIQRGLE